MTPAGVATASKRQPLDYLEELEHRYPGILASNWIPGDRQLWDPERYRDDEAVMLRMCNTWMKQQGLPEGEMLFEVIDPANGEPIALDLAWPYGIRQDYSEKPTALLLGEKNEVVEAAQRAGYQTFTSVPMFYRYVERDILALTEENSQTPTGEPSLPAPTVRPGTLIKRPWPTEPERSPRHSLSSHARSIDAPGPAPYHSRSTMPCTESHGSMADQDDNQEHVDPLAVGELITLQEAAEYAGLAKESLHGYAKRGRLIAKKLGPIWVTTRAGLMTTGISRSPKGGTPRWPPSTIRSPVQHLRSPL